MSAGRISFAAAAILCGMVECASGALTPQPVSLTFPDTDTNASSPSQTITFTNTGGAPVTINGVAMGGTNPGDFSLANGPQMFPLSLAANAAFSIDCIFSPANSGLRQAQVQATIAGMVGTVNVPVSGKGIGPKITVTPSPIVCGNLPFGQQPAPVTVTVSNAGGSVVHVNTVALSGPDAAQFALSGLPNFPQPLGGNASFNFTVQFTPAQPGTANATLTVGSDDPNTPMLATAVTGNSGDPTIKLSVGTIIFGNQRVGIASASQDVTLSNVGLSDLHITALAISGTDPGDFSIVARPMLPATIPIGKSVKMSIDFTPGSGGARSAQVVITNDDPAAMMKLLPVSGTGTTAMASVTPNKIDFGNVKVSTVGGSNFTIANAGTGPVTVNTITIVGNDAALFTVPMMAPFKVPAMGQVVLQVSFKPVAIGMFAATVNLTTDDPNLPMFALPLTGAGTSPMFKATPNVLDFGDVIYGSSAPPQTVTLANNGNQPLTLMTFMVSGPLQADYTIGNQPMTPLVLMPAQKTTFTVAFKPSIDGGEPCTINITTDDPGNLTARISISGYGRQAKMALYPMGSVDCGAILVGTMAVCSTKLEIDNTGDADLNITSVKAIGKMAGPFSTDAMGGFVIAAGDPPRKVTVAFSPTVMGSAMAQIEVTSSDQGVQTATIDVHGVGVSPMIAVSPTQLDFGPITVGMTSMPQTFTVRNTGSTPFTLDHFTTSDPAFGPAMDHLNIAVPAGMSSDLTATFSPTVEGDLSAMLQVYLMGSTVPATMVMVKGSGVMAGKPRSGGCSLAARVAPIALLPLALLLLAGAIVQWRWRRGHCPTSA